MGKDADTIHACMHRNVMLLNPTDAPTRQTAQYVVVSVNSSWLRGVFFFFTELSLQKTRHTCRTYSIRAFFIFVASFIKVKFVSSDVLQLVSSKYRPTALFRLTFFLVVAVHDLKNLVFGLLVQRTNIISTLLLLCIKSFVVCTRRRKLSKNRYPTIMTRCLFMHWRQLLYCSLAWSTI